MTIIGLREPSDSSSWLRPLTGLNHSALAAPQALEPRPDPWPPLDAGDIDFPGFCGKHGT